MLVYSILFILTGIISLGSIFFNLEKKGFLLLWFFITIVTIFRFDTGWDYYWYWYVGDTTFQGTSYYETTYSHLEILHKIIYSITRYLQNPGIYFSMTGMITSYFIFKGIDLQSKCKLLSTSVYLTGIYFFPYSLGFIRQYMAIAIIFYSTYYLNKNNYKRFILNTALTTVFVHYSAVIGFLFLIIKKVKLRWLVIIIINIPIIEKIISYIVRLIYPKYLYYLRKDIVYPLSTQVIMYLLIVLIIYFLEISLKRSQMDSYYMKIVVVGILCYCVFNQHFGGHLGFRIGSYMMIFIVIYTCNILDFFKNKKRMEIVLIAAFLCAGTVTFFQASLQEKKIPVTERKNFNFEFYFGKTVKDFKAKQLP